MPTYEFRCPKGHEFDRFYKTMSTAPLEQPCPTCGAIAKRQLSGGGGLVFKGSGFYLTDYGKNAHRGESAKAKSDSQADGAKSESKSDAKSDTKSESPAPKAESKGGGERGESKSESKPKAEGRESKTESPKPATTPKPKSE